MGKETHSQEFIEEEFCKRGCKLLDRYKNCNTPIKFMCRCGEQATISYKSFRRGCYCLKCGGKQKHTIKEIKQEFASRGYELLETEYKNSLVKMKAKCKCGDNILTSWNNLQQGRDCMKCGIQKMLSKTAKEKHYNWIADRSEAKLRRTISARCRAHLIRALKKIGTEKQDKTYKLLGYTARQLQNHITSHSTWESLKGGDWHIDHIFPVKAFIDFGVHDPKIINCFENLQPMKISDNFRKNAKYDKKAFEAWLNTKE